MVCIPSSRTRAAGRVHPQGAAIGRLARRTLSTSTLTASALCAALWLTACSGAGDDGGETQELDYPDAPTQEIPPASASGTEIDTGADAVAALPVVRLADREWIERTADRTGIPPRALAGYAGAALRTQQTHPECGIGWNTLAGIGAVESAHGTHGGSRIGDDGVASLAIVGVALDGSEGVMEIPDTDGGALDDDAEWDRAVGPMQFIPETWRAYAQDGTLEGRPDPQQVDDAALTAAVYLCETGGDLTEDEQWSSAVSVYNQSLAYVNQVAETAEEYLG